jgi:HAD superfamily hydrolase (TIGR01484 family)
MTRLANLSLLPTCGTQFFRYDADWKKVYSEDLTADEKAKIESSLQKAVSEPGFKPQKLWGEQIEDRGSQITFSALGQQAPLDEKDKWDPDYAKRKKIKAILDTLLPEFSVRMGGATSIDVTKPGIDKAYGVRKLRDILGISLKEMIFIGDALFAGGNDYPAEEAGVVSIPVQGSRRDQAGCRGDHRLSGSGHRWIRNDGQRRDGHGRRGEAGPLVLRRLGTIMEPEPGNPNEVEGVLNPAAVRGPDGNLYLFPRLVAAGNYSRIGIARVRFNGAGDPAGVERLGIALEPEADYELRPDGGGGCEDPRVTFVEPLASYVMTYTAFSPEGPRIALAVSKDLFHWQRLGLVNFTNYHDGRDPGGVDDKDASLFPVAIPNPSGRPELAILHRPLFPGTRPEETALPPRLPRGRPRPGEHLDFVLRDGLRRAIPQSPRPVCLASPPGESGVALGAAQDRRRHAAHPDPPRLADRLPRRERNGGVGHTAGHQLCYSAGVMVLSKEHPQRDPLSFGGAGVDARTAARTHGTSPTSCSPPASTGATISAARTASTSITAWPTTGLAWLASTCRRPCHPEARPLAGRKGQDQAGVRAQG